MKRFLKATAIAACSVALLMVAGTYGASYYYTTQHGAGCGSCHEMADYVGAIHASPHQNQNCMDCHEASLSTKLRHIRVHLSGNVPEAIHLRDVDVVAMTSNCQKCHQHEYATWRAGPHSATYAQIFANQAQNSRQRLMDDCLRCHGMQFDGSIRDLVQPQSLQGPWRIIRKDLQDQPTIPCQSCHWVHREGSTHTKPAERISVAGSATRDSLAFFDRRERMHFAAANLPIPQLQEGPRTVKMSTDRREALCYQCHAPREPETGTTDAANHLGAQVKSGDDRTPTGVHEGLSCLSCHNGHNENARASCATCHPAMSHCGLDVEKMDTTFSHASSRHNIHWVKCTDCHENGVPPMKQTSLAGGQ